MDRAWSVQHSCVVHSIFVQSPFNSCLTSVFLKRSSMKRIMHGSFLAHISYITLCHIASCYIISCDIASCYITSYHIASCCITSCHIALCYITHVTHVTLHHVTSHHFTLQHVTVHHIVSYCTCLFTECNSVHNM